MRKRVIRMLVLNVIFPIVWGVCLFMLLTGAVLLILGQIKGSRIDGADTFFAVGFPCFITEFLLLCLFVFQFHLLRAGMEIPILVKIGFMPVCAFGILYGFSGTSLLLHGLGRHVESAGVAHKVENVFALVSFVLWAALMATYFFLSRKDKRKGT